MRPRHNDQRRHAPHLAQQFQRRVRIEPRKGTLGLDDVRSKNLKCRRECILAIDALRHHRHVRAPECLSDQLCVGLAVFEQ
jgi:aminoglycoside/choline kinase family phosphotransferase